MAESTVHLSNTRNCRNARPFPKHLIQYGVENALWSGRPTRGEMVTQHLPGALNLRVVGAPPDGQAVSGAEQPSRPATLRARAGCHGLAQRPLDHWVAHPR